MISEFNSEIMTNEQFSLYIKEKLSEKADEKEHEEKESMHQNNEHENVHTCKEINHMVIFLLYYYYFIIYITYYKSVIDFSVKYRFI